MKKYIGIDLGGTNVRVAKVDELGNILQVLNAKSHGVEGPRELVRDTIFSLLGQIEDLKECKGIGIAIPGPVDVSRNVMTIANNIKDFEDYPIGDLISERYNMPVYVDNDANMAGLAEATLGAGKEHQIVYFITHSTGIGGALIVGGKVVAGKLGFAGEIGNIIVKDGFPKRSEYLNGGSVESEASGSALTRMAKEIWGEECSSRNIFEKAKLKDQKALEIINTMADDMGRLLATIGQIVDPHCFVIGGGVANQSEMYWPRMIETYHRLFNGKEPAVIVKTELEEPGVLGAAMLVKSHEKD